MYKKLPEEKVKFFIYVRYFYYHKILLLNTVSVYSLSTKKRAKRIVDKVNLHKGNCATYSFECIHYSSNCQYQYVVSIAEQEGPTTTPVKRSRGYCLNFHKETHLPW